MRRRLDRRIRRRRQPARPRARHRRPAERRPRRCGAGRCDPAAAPREAVAPTRPHRYVPHTVVPGRRDASTVVHAADASGTRPKAGWCRNLGAAAHQASPVLQPIRASTSEESAVLRAGRLIRGRRGARRARGRRPGRQRPTHGRGGMDTETRWSSTSGRTGSAGSTSGCTTSRSDHRHFERSAGRTSWSSSSASTRGGFAPDVAQLRRSPGRSTGSTSTRAAQSWAGEVSRSSSATRRTASS